MTAVFNSSLFEVLSLQLSLFEELQHEAPTGSLAVTEEQQESTVSNSTESLLQHNDSFILSDVLQQSEAGSSAEFEQWHEAEGSGSSGSVQQHDAFSSTWVVDGADATAVALEFSETVVCSVLLQQLWASLLLFWQQDFCLGSCIRHSPF
ncbi:hypothetical protein [Terribacillus saccharophilus]|uniref:hypothetical protein n=1 Tax=Terribacillus saccharophilus TaxID=361277 RepID=UPI0020D19C6A|nr:hypothetical protein [Terribacillus saccharophilus]